MCGLIFHLRRVQQISQSSSLLPAQEPTQSHLDTLIRARGPDSFLSLHRTLNINSDTALHLTFSASILALRSLEPIIQPLVDTTTGSMLMWNGEAWRYRGNVIEENDTGVVFAALKAAVAGLEDAAMRGLAVRNVLRSVEGPFTFVFYDVKSQRIWYGRDSVGRRSLLRTRGLDGEVCIASVSDARPESAWEEVKTGGIYELDLVQIESGDLFQEQFIPWADPTENFFPRLNRRTDFPSDYSLPSPESVQGLTSKLETSMLLRTRATTPWIESSNSRDEFAVLFSGGVDCTLLAFMLDRVLPPGHSIDLLNVAFENPRVVAAAQKQSTKNKNSSTATHVEAYDTCPDRKTGLSSYAELQRLCPKREWRFVAVNVPYTETLAQTPLVTALMYPHNTEMDLSIALALFFASRGQGEIYEPEGNRSYTTRAKILFSGLGADEVFAGYTRHTKAFAYSGIGGLIDELDLDFNRLADRNLGRDDRVISHWGREVRHPYLDETLNAWALGLPIWEKCGFVGNAELKNDQLEPGKLLLRMVANQCGLIAASMEKKRAIQFGSRTAKMTLGRTKGTDTIGA